MSRKGKLFVIATPIGNLGDFSTRAKNVLNEVNFVIAEDSRTFSKLICGTSIKPEVISYHEHNEIRRAESIIQRLVNGESAALVSEAGTPGICDPGYRIVRACRLHGVEVVSVPGACAAVSALSISGLPCDSFYFGGFLPKKDKKCRDVLEKSLILDCTSIFYETPHRIEKTLELIAVLAPERELFLARELTKLHESGYFGGAETILKVLRENKEIRGEFVLVISKE